MSRSRARGAVHAGRVCRLMCGAAAMVVVVGLGGCAPEPVTCRADAGLSASERLAGHLEEEAAEGFNGAVLITNGSSVVLDAEYPGAASDTGARGFWIASISKTITAVAVLRLVEEGKLDLHAPIGTYLEGVPPRWSGVTAHHLLSHRSGLPHEYAADGVADREQALRALLAQEPVKPLGEFSYSNDGYNLLAILIELRSGEPFESYVRSRVFAPAGMEQSGFWGLEPKPSPVATVANASRASRTSTNIWRNGRSVANWGYRGASGIHTTAGDLHRFVAALQGGRLLQDNTVASMLSSKNPSFGPEGQTYGYGWALRLAEGRVVEFWHGGNEDWLGHNGLLKVSGERTVVILSNSGDIGEGSWSARIDAGLKACSALDVAS